MPDIENWSPQQVLEGLENHEIVLIDVRTPPEYMIEHVEGALLMPMSFFKADCLPTQDGKRIILHCGSGVRSKKMTEEMARAGIAPLAHMEGGFAAWKQAGLEFMGTEMSSGAPKKMKVTPPAA